MNDDTKLQQLFHLLRLCGAAMIVAAAGTFLVQSWDDTGDVVRYLALLGTTALLPVLAYTCGIRLRESQSARVLVVTFLTLVPIHAGVLGGFVLSQFGDPSAAVGTVAQWAAPSRSAAIALVSAAAAILAPLTWGAFRVLSRPHASLLSAMSAGGHALVLIPDRSVQTATLVMAPIVAAAGWCAWRVKPATREAKVAVGFLLAPAAVIAARQVFFYEVSSAFWAAILATFAVALFLLGRRSVDTSVERVAFVPMMLATFAITMDSPMLRHASVSANWLLYGWVTAAACLGFAWASKRSKGFFVGAALALNAFTATTTLLCMPRPWAALQALALGLCVASFGFIRSRKSALYSGVALASLGFIIEVAHAIEAFEPSGWLALAGFGGMLVVLTAWLERRARLARSPAPLAKLSESSGAELS